MSYHVNSQGRQQELPLLPQPLDSFPKKKKKKKKKKGKSRDDDKPQKSKQLIRTEWLSAHRGGGGGHGCFNESCSEKGKDRKGKERKGKERIRRGEEIRACVCVCVCVVVVGYVQ